MTPLSDDAVTAAMQELPALPSAVMALMRMLHDDAVSTDELAGRIGQDAALAAKTLRLANSPFYGMPRQVNCITDATTILGLQTVVNVAVAASVVEGLRAPTCPGFEFAAFWRHAIGTALCAAALARALNRDEGAAFTAGLLHDIGRLALAARLPKAYAAVIEAQRKHDVPAFEAEHATLGTDHAAAGRRLALHWKFGEQIAQAIGDHHAPPPNAAAGGSAPAPLCDLVHVADNMAHALDLSQDADDLVPPLSMPAWLRLGLDEAICLKVFAQTEAQHTAVCAALLG